MNYFSAVTVPVTLLDSERNDIATATAFVHSRKDNILRVVTNWHVVSGRDPGRPTKTLWKNTPVFVQLHFHKLDARKDGKYTLLNESWTSIGQINDNLGEAPEWREHPVFRHRVDVAVLDVAIEPLIIDELYVHELSAYSNFEKRYKPCAADEAIVIGYPWGLTGGGLVLPLYKRGIVASEPSVNENGLPRFLIDCQTTDGMSGSPVIIRHNGVWSPNGVMDGDTIFGQIETFAGVYSGRRGSAIAGACQVSDIGIVWKSEIVDLIVEQGVKGSGLSEMIK